MAVDDRMGPQVAAGEIRVELGKPERVVAQARTGGADRRVLAPARAGKAHRSIEAAAHGRKRQRRQVAEIAGTDRQGALGEEAVGVHDRLSIRRDGAESEGEPVEGVVAPVRPDDVGLGPQRLAGDVAGHAQGAVEGIAQVVQRRVEAQIPDRTPVGSHLRCAERGGDRRLEQGARQPRIGARRPGQTLIEGREVLEIDAGGDVCGLRVRLSLECGDEPRALEAQALETVAIIGLRDASRQRRSTADEPVGGRLAEHETATAQVEVGGERLAGGISAQDRLGIETAGEGPARDGRKGADIGQSRLERAGQRVLSDAAPA
ncbi:hypothetical protein M2440_004006 [Methylorubrum extorquens]|nr:hypothetical protein [Methylorubrum extorquens]